ncbi:DNA cytosine methyltransferase [Staphylococcus caprae]|uniref:DNA cytosine methyltransferase n=1 Tax=Staphylococcus TaxID=1279 RepID=UPI0008A8837B|nr:MULTISPECIES: DNA cytosine methyltransferase [Staphylococcus]OHO69667.1 DNA cytosine methyltransferase [Staphylococcus sp. HMSC036D05]
MINSVSSTHHRKYSLAAFFSGVGGIELGFEQTNEFRVMYANEFDKNAQITYCTNFENVDLDKRDIHEVKVEEIPDTDIIVGGFPCQAFSIAGYRKGFDDDRGDLFFELLRIIQSKRPECIFIENVKNMVTHDHGNTFKVIKEALVLNGYSIKWKVLNAKDYGNIPQNRERIYIVGFKNKKAFSNFKFPDEVKLTTELNEVIDYENEKDERYYYRKNKQPFYSQLEEGMVRDDLIYQWRRKYVRANKSGVVPTLTANMGTGGHNVPLIMTKYGIRKLTPRETFNVQGFPKDFELPKDMSNGQLYKQAGNSVVVSVIKRIAHEIYEALSTLDDEEMTFDMNGKYSLIYNKMLGRFEGESYLERNFDSNKTLNNYLKKNDIRFISDEEYTRITKNNKTKDFYIIK